MTVWGIRAGRAGEREAWCLENGYAGGGWHEIPSLVEAQSRDDVRAILDGARPEDSVAKRNNNTGQLWGLRSVQPGDIVVMPMKTTKTLAIGRATSGYEYLDDPDPGRRHVIRVEWTRDDVPRSAIKDDLLYTLGAFMTIFKASRNEAESRFAEVLEHGVDPGSLATTTVPLTSKDEDDAAEQAVSYPVTVPTLETIRDRVRTHIAENFKGHQLTELVAAILRTRGFVCDVSPPGPDQGVDILAGSGPLGLDSPTLIVEVKSEAGQISAHVVRGLQGAMLSNRAEQGLLVAWGGITKDAGREIRTDRLTMRVWTADDLLDELFDVYDQLPQRPTTLTGPIDVRTQTRDASVHNVLPRSRPTEAPHH
jgi:restriction system protein